MNRISASYLLAGFLAAASVSTAYSLEIKTTTVHIATPHMIVHPAPSGAAASNFDPNPQGNRDSGAGRGNSNSNTGGQGSGLGIGESTPNYKIDGKSKRARDIHTPMPGSMQ